MSQPKFYSPLKIGLLIVSISYFLFTFHALFTLSWIGEWEPLGGSFGFIIFVEDISASIGLIFRFIASLTALVGMVLYFVRKGLPEQTIRKMLRLILVTEAIYWLGLLVSGVLPLFYLGSFGGRQLLSVLTSIMLSEIPCLVESIAIPLALFKLAFALNPNKPARGAIKWGLIAGSIYVFVFWLINSSIWIITVRQKGTEYLTSYSENLLSFALTTIGLLALALYTAYSSKKSIGTETLNELKLKTLGAITTALGLYFFWNYLSWVLFNSPWSDWYAWLFGHNMDLWMLSIPLVGLPLLFKRKAS